MTKANDDEYNELLASFPRKYMPVKSLNKNKSNPRYIKEEKYNQLVESIKKFPQMLAIRPIVFDSSDNNKVLGGNQRLSAAIDAGLIGVWGIDAATLTQEQKNQFIIKDNVPFGTWDWDMLGNEWEEDDLLSWGLDIFEDIPDDEDEEDDDQGDSTPKTKECPNCGHIF